LLLALAGCGTTVGVIPFSGTGRGETVVNLDAGAKVRFWTDFEAQYAGPVLASYDVQLLQGGVPVATATCDPIDFGAGRVCVNSVNVGGRHSYRCRMSCQARVPRSAPTQVRATFSIAGGPVRLVRADLDIRQ
jgi:hypothetical protein